MCAVPLIKFSMLMSFFTAPYDILSYQLLEHVYTDTIDIYRQFLPNLSPAYNQKEQKLTIMLLQVEILYIYTKCSSAKF